MPGSPPIPETWERAPRTGSVELRAWPAHSIPVPSEGFVSGSIKNS